MAVIDPARPRTLIPRSEGTSVSMGAGAIVGIVIACLVFVFFLYRCCCHQPSPERRARRITQRRLRDPEFQRDISNIRIPPKVYYNSRY